MTKKKNITVGGVDIVIVDNNDQDYISLTDMARFKNRTEPTYVIQNWMRSRYAIEYCGLWERLNNPEFKHLDFDVFKNEAGSNSFVLTPQRWINSTNAIGITSKSGRYGGTYAHKDIAFEFGTWLSPEFKLYLVREFQRLKEKEDPKQKLHWNFQRHLAKVNYKIHTDAIKENLIPSFLTRRQITALYASEADLLNMALYGLTAREWQAIHPDERGNMRDHSTIQQLIVLSNLESLNAVLIEQKIPAAARLEQLNKVAVTQMKSLLNEPVAPQSLVSRVEEELRPYNLAS